MGRRACAIEIAGKVARLRDGKGAKTSRATQADAAIVGTVTRSARIKCCPGCEAPPEAAALRAVLDNALSSRDPAAVPTMAASACSAVQARHLRCCGLCDVRE